MFVLISIIAVICVGAPFGRPSETAELNKSIDKNEEQISAATATTVNAGDTYTVEKDGIYKIELHGGHGKGVEKVNGRNGGKVTGYIELSKGNSLTTASRLGGQGAGGFNGGDGIHVKLNDTILMGAGGGCGIGVTAGNFSCSSCKKIQEYWIVDTCDAGIYDDKTLETGAEYDPFKPSGDVTAYFGLRCPECGGTSQKKKGAVSIWSLRGGRRISC